MKTAMALSVVVLLLCFNQRVMAKEPDDAAGKLAKMLHGEWEGGPCMGDWSFGADGKFALTNYSPGGNQFSGDWKIRWDALPPTLVLTFKTSNAPNHFKVGQTWDLKLAQLDGKKIGYIRPDDTKPIFCTRPE